MENLTKIEVDTMVDLRDLPEYKDVANYQGFARVYKLNDNIVTFLSFPGEKNTIEINKLQIAPSPLYNKYEDGLLIIDSRLPNGKEIYTQAIHYGFEHKFISCGSQVESCYLLEDKGMIKIKFKSWKQKTIKISIEDLQNFKVN